MTTTTPTPVLEFSKDGSMITVNRPGFRNMQEDPCGFGKTRVEAMLDLFKREGMAPLAASQEITAYLTANPTPDPATQQPAFPEMASAGEQVAKRKGKAHTKYYTSAGEQVPGVTTVLGVINKPFLVKWANNLGLQGIDSSKYVDALAHIGTITHYLVQCDLAGVQPYLDDFSPNDLSAARRCFASWEAWRRGKEIIPILAEYPLVSDVHGYGGTIDHYVLIDGIPTLLDIKTAKAVYSEQLCQVAAYRELLTEHHHDVERACIVRIGREEGEGFEDKTVDALYERFDVFSHALAIYRLQKTLRW